MAPSAQAAAVMGSKELGQAMCTCVCGLPFGRQGQCCSVGFDEPSATVSSSVQCCRMCQLAPSQFGRLLVLGDPAVIQHTTGIVYRLFWFVHRAGDANWNAFQDCHSQ
jgi:hypothetical protein